jgi:hypothetical protein
MARSVLDRGLIRNTIVTDADATGRFVPMQIQDRALFDGGRIQILIKIDVEGYEAKVLRGARSGGAGP